MLPWSLRSCCSRPFSPWGKPLTSCALRSPRRVRAFPRTAAVALPDGGIAETRYASRMTRALMLALILSTASMPVYAQINGSSRSTQQAYGARLNAEAQPNGADSGRVNSRVNNRINNRLSLRVGRYETSNPTAALRAQQGDAATQKAR